MLPYTAIWRYCSFCYIATILIVILLVNLRTAESSCEKVCINEKVLRGRNYRPIAGSPPLLRLLVRKDQAIRRLIGEELNAKISQGHQTQEPCCLSWMKRFVSHFEATAHPNKATQLRNVTNETLLNVAWNPLTVFQLFYRFKNFLTPLLTHLGTNSELRHKINNELEELGLPAEQDFKTAVSAILRIQHVYDLDTADLARGKIAGEETGVTLSADEIHEIGKYAMMESSYALAVEWLQMANELVHEEEMPNVTDSVHLSVLENNLQLSMAIHNSEFDNEDEWGARFFTTKVSHETTLRTRRRTSQLEEWGGRYETVNEVNYWGLCSGEIYQNATERAKLFCYYETKINSAWTINPLKVELMALKPFFIIQYHDLIGEKLMQYVKSTAESSIEPSEIIEGSEAVVATKVRTSFSTGLEDETDERLGRLALVAELATGLGASRKASSKELQVASYAPGSHYSVHLDATGLDDLEAENITYFLTHGDRLATFLYYLSDVAKGGETAFTMAGVAAAPIKGSAILWFNLNRASQLEETTWHSSCPVVLGEKWIANMWILNYDQMFHPDYQCSLDREESVDFRINGRSIKSLQ